MITVGYWCDQCRVKYVQHRCKPQLLCRHSWDNAVWVWCQAFGRGGEHVEMAWGYNGHRLSATADLWLTPKRKRYTSYGPGAVTFWGTRVHRFREPEPEWWVGEWLASQPENVVRAFLRRWESAKEVPDWLAFKMHPDAERARALEKTRRVA